IALVGLLQHILQPLAQGSPAANATWLVLLLRSVRRVFTEYAVPLRDNGFHQELLQLLATAFQLRVAVEPAESMLAYVSDDYVRRYNTPIEEPSDDENDAAFEDEEEDMAGADLTRASPINGRSAARKLWDDTSDRILFEIFSPELTDQFIGLA